MTETDATVRPLQMPVNFIPYLDKYRVYRIFKLMLEDLILNLPKDHLLHMKIWLAKNMITVKDTDRVMMLVDPQLHSQIEVRKLVKEIVKDLGYFVITRHSILDNYEKHDEFKPGCISTVLMSEVAKKMTKREVVATAGWLMFDHPCTVREARCLQQDGVLPTVTLVLTPPEPTSESADNHSTPARGFNDQDFVGLKYAYKATLKEVWIEPEDNLEKITHKCLTAIQTFRAGVQGPGQNHVYGAPSVFRVLIIGPRGSGRKTHARILARHFGLVYLDFQVLYREAKVRNDDVGIKLRKYGLTVQSKADIVRRRIMMKDCLDLGWVLTEYPLTGMDFEMIDTMPTPPNRIIILNADWATCKARAMSMHVDWCTGKRVPAGSGPRAVKTPGETKKDIENELEFYFTEAVAELRAAAGITAVEINTQDTIEQTQVKIQAAVIANPNYDIVSCAKIRNVRGD